MRHDEARETLALAAAGESWRDIRTVLFVARVSAHRSPLPVAYAARLFLSLGKDVRGVLGVGEGEV